MPNPKLEIEIIENGILVHDMTSPVKRITTFFRDEDNTAEAVRLKLKGAIGPLKPLSST